ncbi:MAG: metallophosphoesterase [Ignavibacteriaceae bacterium]
MQYIIRVLLFITILFLCEFYFVKTTLKSLRLIYPSLSQKRIKFFRNVFLVFFNLYPILIVIIWSYQGITATVNLSFPQGKLIDYLLIYPFWFFFILVVQCMLLFLIIDVLKLILRPVYKKIKSKILPYETRVIFIIVVFFAAYVPLRMFYDYNTINIRETVYHRKDIPEELNNFRIVFISDIHADRYTDRKRISKFVRYVNSQNPDLVLIGGDFISSRPEYIDTAAKYLGRINSKYGIYSCVGDHDNWAYRRDNARSRREITDALAKQNIFMFDDERRTLLIYTAKIGITFATETYTKRVSQNALDSLVDHSASENDLNIMLVHQPRQMVINEAVKKHYDLILAGHTHGGQITFLFPFINLTPTLIETTRIKGDFHLGKTMMVITPGLGMSIAPERYNSTPEVTVIDIKK